MPRNPSELQRLEEERLDVLEQLDKPNSKAYKENLLRELRDLERQLGIKSIPYNSDAFSKQIR